jgi:hypothetical protein
MSATIREAVLEVFERHRAAPGTPFDESHFLDYLLAKPRDQRAVHDSLKCSFASASASRCTTSIRFTSLSSVWRSFGLPGGPSLASFRHQQRYGFGWRTVFVGNLLAVSLAVGATRVSQPLAVARFLSCVLANGVVGRFYLRWRAYRMRLLGQLQAPVGDDAA